MSGLPELYVAVDVEADGPIPGPYSMISLGMAVAGRADLMFYTELRPISDRFVPEALAVSGLDQQRLLQEAPSAEEAMTAAGRWLTGLRRLGRPVFLAAPAVWDGMFVHWYFVRYTGRSPFGATGSGVDLRSYWMGRTGGHWASTRKDRIKKALGLADLPHTHHAGEDAAELALNRPGFGGGSESTRRMESCQHRGSIRPSCASARSGLRLMWPRRTAVSPGRAGGSASSWASTRTRCAAG